MRALINPCFGDDHSGADEEERERRLPPDPRVDLWTGHVGEVLVIIGTYHGVLDVQARVRGSQHWHPASPDLEARATIKALAEKPWIEDELRAGVLERLRARGGVR